MTLEAKSWARLLAEAVAIVTSILLAFAIDAWWSERQARQEEAEAIAGLRVEFTANVMAIDAVADHHRHSIEAMERLLAMANHEESIAARPLLDSLLMSASIDFVTYE